jgi:hypothetical protein
MRFMGKGKPPRMEDCDVCGPAIEEALKEKGLTNIQTNQLIILSNYPCQGTLPTQKLCGWEGHDDAVNEIGWCSVCQHGDFDFPLPD